MYLFNNVVENQKHGLESLLMGGQYPLKLLRYSRAQDRGKFLGLGARSGRINPLSESNAFVPNFLMIDQLK